MINWENIRLECIKTNKIIKLEKSGDEILPSEFHEADLGLSKGALKQYRDNRGIYSLHIHEFPDYFLAHVDTFNPESHPVAHGFTDTPGIAMGILAGGVVLYLLAKSIQSLGFFPPEDNNF